MSRSRTVRIDVELDDLLEKISKEQHITKTEAARRIAKITKNIKYREGSESIRWF